MRVKNAAWKGWMVALLAAVILVGCDSEGSGGDEEQHPEVAQLVIEANGEAVVTVANGTVTGELTMFLNAETDVLRVRLLRPDGSEIEVTEPADLSLRHQVENSSVALYREQVEPMTFTLLGKGLGQTTLSYDLFHGEHRDYESPAITVRVIDTP